MIASGVSEHLSEEGIHAINCLTSDNSFSASVTAHRRATACADPASASYRPPKIRRRAIPQIATVLLRRTGLGGPRRQVISRSATDSAASESEGPTTPRTAHDTLRRYRPNVDSRSRVLLIISSRRWQASRGVDHLAGGGVAVDVLLPAFW